LFLLSLIQALKYFFWFDFWDSCLANIVENAFAFDCYTFTTEIKLQYISTQTLAFVLIQEKNFKIVKQNVFYIKQSIGKTVQRILFHLIKT
jgi:hypothetical protein